MSHKIVTLGELFQQAEPEQWVRDLFGTAELRVPLPVSAVDPGGLLTSIGHPMGKDLEAEARRNGTWHMARHYLRRVGPPIVADGRRILDGNHRALAALLAGRPVEAVNAEDLFLREGKDAAIESNVYIGLATDRRATARLIDVYAFAEANGESPTHASTFAGRTYDGNQRWRYPAGSRYVFWWEPPSALQKDAVNHYLAARGIIGVLHRVCADPDVAGEVAAERDYDVAHGIELPRTRRARRVVEAESLKSFLRATYMPWVVHAIPATTYVVEFRYDGEFDQNLVLEPDNSEASLRLLRRALGWLYPKMPYAPDGKWLPRSWLKPAAEAGLLDQCAAETGVRLRVASKTGLAVQEELRSKV